MVILKIIVKIIVLKNVNQKVSIRGICMKIIAKNRKAYHDFFIEDTFEAGIALMGTEIKSVRNGNVNLKDSFVRIKGNEAYLENMHISPYEQGNRFNHEPLRNRKLLLHKKELLKITNILKAGGLTIVPTKLYFNKGSKVKVEIGIAKGKKLYDKRQDLKAKDAKRDMERSLKNY